jgi:hypothetical protein
MADNKLRGITWDKTPEVEEAPGVTWDKPSVAESIKRGAQKAFTPEAIEELGKRIPASAAGRIAAPVRFATSAARIPANLMKMAGVEGPAEFVKTAEEGAKNLTESAGYKGGLDVAAGFGGDVALGGAAFKAASKLAPVVSALPGGAAVVKGIKESPMSQAILGGMGLGAAGSSGSPYDVLTEAGQGGLFGLGGQAAASGLGSLAAPVLKRYNELKDLGYSKAEILKDTTIGQLLGGKTQALENFLGELPFLGVGQSIEKGAKSLYGALENKVGPILQRQKSAENILGTSLNQFKTAEGRAIEDAAKLAKSKLEIGQSKQTEALKSMESAINIPAVNYALKPLGITIPADTPADEAIRLGQKAISDGYANSLGNFSNMRLTKSVQDDLRSLSNTYGDKYLGKDNSELFKNDIERLIADTSTGKWLTPDNWQRNLSQLSEEAFQMRLKDPRYSKALYELKDKWMDVIEGQVGSDLFKATNTAFSKFKVPERAAAYAKSIKAGGEFSPNELVNALKAELSTKRLAGGEDELQKMAVAAYNKIMADRKGLTETQKKAKEKLSDLITLRNRESQDKFSGMQSGLEKQKAALQSQSEKAIGANREAIEAAVGPKNMSDPATRRLSYTIGAGSLMGGGYGLSRFGVDPMVSLGLAGGTIAGTRGLYSPAVQNFLKEKALANRPEYIRRMGESLKQNAPVAGLAAAQQGQSRPEDEETSPLNSMQVPQ